MSIHKYFKEDLPREKFECIEKSPQDYYPSDTILDDSTQLIFKKLEVTEEMLDESTCIGKKYKLSKKLLDNQREFNAKNQSKTSKTKSKKDNSRADKSTMAKI